MLNMKVWVFLAAISTEVSFPFSDSTPKFWQEGQIFSSFETTGQLVSWHPCSLPVNFGSLEEQCNEAEGDGLAQ